MSSDVMAWALGVLAVLVVVEGRYLVRFHDRLCRLGERVAALEAREHDGRARDPRSSGSADGR